MKDPGASDCGEAVHRQDGDVSLGNGLGGTLGGVLGLNVDSYRSYVHDFSPILTYSAKTAAGPDAVKTMGSMVCRFGL